VKLPEKKIEKTRHSAATWRTRAGSFGGSFRKTVGWRDTMAGVTQSDSLAYTYNLSCDLCINFIDLFINYLIYFLFLNFFFFFLVLFPHFIHSILHLSVFD